LLVGTGCTVLGMVCLSFCSGEFLASSQSL
jgi:hypothetical protein